MSNKTNVLIRLLLVGFLAPLIAASCGDEAKPGAKTTVRDPRWARPIEKQGLPNLHEVADGLYRGAQPEPEGFKELQKMGVKTIINLRNLHDDYDEIEEAGLKKDDFKHEPIPLNAWKASDDHVIRFLKIVNDPNNRPVFFHCQHGADRTGTMAAVYRMVVEGWSKEDALKEMTEGGYGFHSVWQNLIDYMNTLDVGKIQKSIK